MKEWSNLAKVVYKRTYARNDFNKIENWEDTVNRAIQGNIRNHKVTKEEIDKLRYLLLNRKATPAGRGLWFSGSPAHDRVGGRALVNCWGTHSEEWENFVLAQDLLMLGGGVGFSVEHRFTSKLPKVKKGVNINHQLTKDADFIMPDSREGWNEMTRRILKSYFVTGKSFNYSTICIRGAGELIKGFGGKASGPGIFVEFVNKLNSILQAREGRHIRPIDSADIICAIGEMVVSGNVRRSAILILGDCWDKDYLKAKRWDLGVLPSYRAMANYSVVCDDTDDLHPLYWKTYEIGEPFGIVNRKNIQTYGRMGEKKKDTAYLVNPCITGDTLIYVADGRGNISIKTLAEENKDVPVFCLSNSDELGVRWMRNPRLTGRRVPIYKVTLDDGSIFRATENHKFRLKSGDYREVKEIQVGDSLKIITRYESSIKDVFKKATGAEKNYWWVNNGQAKNFMEHRLIAEFSYNKEIPTGYVVHHKDRDSKNNSPSNLEILPKQEHDKLHREQMLGKNNPMVRAATEWSAEKWEDYRNKQRNNSLGSKNGNFSGATENDLRTHAIILTNNLGRRFSYSEWVEYAEKNDLPAHFNKWRKDQVGGTVSLSKWAALESGLEKIEGDIRALESYRKYTSLGYNCDIINGRNFILKSCEGCSAGLKLYPRAREQSVCLSCSIKKINKNLDIIEKRSISNRITVDKKQDEVRSKQLDVYTKLKFNLHRDPKKKEWEKECRSLSISIEISRKSSPFKSFNELKYQADFFNHRVTSVELVGYEDVYNGTVDEFHNFFICGKESTTKNNKIKFIYLNNLNCGEATLEDKEACNLTELYLPNLEDETEFVTAAKLMHRWSKRVTCEDFKNDDLNNVISKNRRIGTGITGCLQSSLFNAGILDTVYEEIQKENIKYSKELGIEESIRTTVVKPSGTLSLLGETTPGVHASYSRYYVRRVRFASNDALIPVLKNCGHYMEPVQRLDGSLDHNTSVVDFYCETIKGTPCIDEGFDTWKQLDTLMFAQKHWADQAVSVTIYYKKDEIPKIKEWLANNLCNLKTISFLCYNDHGFKQAPLEAMLKEDYEKKSSKIKSIVEDNIQGGELENLECQGGVCPVK